MNSFGTTQAGLRCSEAMRRPLPCKVNQISQTPVHKKQIWESLYNPDFNCTEFGAIRKQYGLNSFKISVREFRRFRAEAQLLIGWSAKRELSKIKAMS